jgi:hypothetical protein
VADPIYTSASPIAVNPANGELIGGATFTVHAPDDTSFSTPLAVTDPNTGVAINPLRSNSNGTLPAFKVAGDLPRVKLKSGGFVTELVSLDGLVAEQITNAGLDSATVSAAIAAAGTATTKAGEASTSAAAAADAATLATQKASAVAEVVATNDGIMSNVLDTPGTAFGGKVDQRIEDGVAAVAPSVLAAQPAIVAAADAAVVGAMAGRDVAAVMPASEETVLFTVVDENDRRSWLEFGPDGGPTAHAAQKITAAVSGPVGEAVSTTLGLVSQNHDITGVAFVVVDENDRVTDLEVGTDGHFTQRVIDLLSARLIVPTPADPIRAVLPSALRLLQGRTYRLNYADIIGALAGDYRLRMTGPASNSGNFGTYWQYTPTAAGAWNLTLTVLDRAGATVLTVTVPVTVYAPIASSPTTRLLAIGDSITRPNKYNSVAAGMVGAVTRGTRTYDAGATRGEGRGGWSLNNYFTSIGSAAAGDSPFLFPTSVADGAKFWGNTEFWRKVGYVSMASLPANGYDFDGFQRMARGWTDSGPLQFDANGYPTTPAEGDVVVDPTKAAGSQWLQYTSGSWVTIATPTLEFSFSKYMQRYAAAFADGAPTAISVMLSTNDWFGSLTDAAWATWVSRVQTMIASIRAWNANVPIIIIAAPVGGPDTNWGGGQTVNKVDFDARMRDVAARQIATFDTSAMRTNKVHFISFLGSVAPENMADHVHPKDPEGHAQFAPWLAGKLAQIITEGA